MTACSIVRQAGSVAVHACRSSQAVLLKIVSGSTIDSKEVGTYMWDDF